MVHPAGITRVLLVTDATHMTRATRNFKRHGFTPIAAPIFAQIASAKARTSALGRRESRIYEEMINGGRASFLSAPLEGMLEGGVPILADGQCVGVSSVKCAKTCRSPRRALPHWRCRLRAFRADSPGRRLAA